MTEPWWAKSEPDPVEQFRYRTLDWLTYPYQTIADPRMGDAVRIPEIRQQVTWKDEP